MVKGLPQVSAGCVVVESVNTASKHSPHSRLHRLWMTAGPRPLASSTDVRRRETFCRSPVDHHSVRASEHKVLKFTEDGEVVNVRVTSGYDRSGRPTIFNYAFVAFGKSDGVDAALASQLIRLSNGNTVYVKRTGNRHWLIA
ncbi:hypothetical protein QTP88_023480 [Uroleucon formosanum]